MTDKMTDKRDEIAERLWNGLSLNGIRAALDEARQEDRAEIERLKAVRIEDDDHMEARLAILRAEIQRLHKLWLDRGQEIGALQVEIERLRAKVRLADGATAQTVLQLDARAEATEAKLADLEGEREDWLVEDAAFHAVTVERDALEAKLAEAQEKHTRDLLFWRNGCEERERWLKEREAKLAEVNEQLENRRLVDMEAVAKAGALEALDSQIAAEEALAAERERNRKLREALTQAADRLILLAGVLPKAADRDTAARWCEVAREAAALRDEPEEKP